jgi:hypothetical protein
MRKGEYTTSIAMDSPFDQCDDLILRTIAQALIDARQWHSLAELAQTCRRWRQIAQPLIAQYDVECEARVVAKATPEHRAWADEDGQAHRHHDLPALIGMDGWRVWCHHGKYHRIGPHGENIGPACIYSDGTQEWYQHGKLHRDDGPAIICADGSQVWCQHGEWHRAGPHGEDIGPAVVWAGVAQNWLQRGVDHRAGPHGEDIGPAIICTDGAQQWFQHGERHRAGPKGEDIGPAVIDADGSREWWQHGKKIREERIARP